MLRRVICQIYSFSCLWVRGARAADLGRMPRRLALAAEPFTVESIAEIFTALTGKPVTPAEFADMRRALAAAGCLGKGEADADLALARALTSALTSPANGVSESG
jgi:hypothetical protein